MDLQQARKHLEAQRVDLRTLAAAQHELLDDRSELFDELSSADQHPADAASAVLEREVALSLLRDAEEHGADVDHALAKIAAGTYGTCEVCRARIPDERLDARPDTRFCIEHERTWERSPGIEPTGAHDLELVPDDEAPEELSLAVEETALHVEPDGPPLAPADVAAAIAVEDVTRIE